MKTIIIHYALIILLGLCISALLAFSAFALESGVEIAILKIQAYGGRALGGAALLGVAAAALVESFNRRGTK
jgi:hypothetical protein